MAMPDPGEYGFNIISLAHPSGTPIPVWNEFYIVKFITPGTLGWALSRLSYLLHTGEDMKGQLVVVRYNDFEWISLQHYFTRKSSFDFEKEHENEREKDLGHA